MADNQVVLATFSDEAGAEAAVESLKAWDQAEDRVKLTSIGILVVDEDGQVKGAQAGRA